MQYLLCSSLAAGLSRPSAAVSIWAPGLNAKQSCTFARLFPPMDCTPLPLSTSHKTASKPPLPSHAGASPFLEHHVFQAACEPFEQGEGGMRWRVEEDVLVNADAIAASLALYRFVLLRSTRSAKAPEGAPALRPTLVSAEGVASTLRQHLLPLRALTVRLLQLHTRHLGDAAGGTGPGTGGGGSSEGVAEEVEGWLGLQRLLDVVKRVVEIAQGWGES